MLRIGTKVTEKNVFLWSSSKIADIAEKTKKIIGTDWPWDSKTVRSNYQLKISQQDPNRNFIARR